MDKYLHPRRKLPFARTSLTGHGPVTRGYAWVNAFAAVWSGNALHVNRRGLLTDLIAGPNKASQPAITTAGTFQLAGAPRLSICEPLST